jgi:hypothetical protein
VARLDDRRFAVAVLPARLDEVLVDLSGKANDDDVPGAAALHRLDRDIVRRQRQ